MMVECCQSPAGEHDEDWMMSESMCNTGSRLGGETKFESGVACSELEWGSDLVTEEARGCCYNVGYGAMMVECCQSPAGDHDEDWMMSESMCDTESRLGGETRFESGVACSELEWGADLVEEEARGCCYNLGYGAMMVECCQSPAGEHDEDWMMSESMCDTESRLGGATKFESGVACSELEWGADLATDDEMADFETFEEFQAWCTVRDSEETCRSCGRWRASLESKFARRPAVISER